MKEERKSINKGTLIFLSIVVATIILGTIALNVAFKHDMQIIEEGLEDSYEGNRIVNGMVFNGEKDSKGYKIPADLDTFISRLRQINPYKQPVRLTYLEYFQGKFNDYSVDFNFDVGYPEDDTWIFHFSDPCSVTYSLSGRWKFLVASDSSDLEQYMERIRKSMSEKLLYVTFLVTMGILIFYFFIYLERSFALCMDTV